MSNKHKSDSKLARYLRSRGTWIPDLNKYKAPNGDKHLLCALCDAPHASFGLLKRDPSNLLIVVGPPVAFVCGNCHTDILDMEQLIGSTDLSHNITILDIERNGKFDFLLFEGKFSEDTYYFLEHLESRWEFPQTDIPYEHKEICYFCEGKFDFSSGRLDIWVPVGAISIYTIDGGVLPMCTACRQNLENQLPENSIRYFYMNTFKTDTCTNCEEVYYITKDEDEMRHQSKRRGQYQCPACTYKYLHTSTLDRLLVPKRNSGGKLNRYVDDICDLCHEAFCVDQMWSPDAVLKNHINKEAKIICENCRCGDILAFLAIKKEHFVYNVAFSENKYYVTSRTLEGRILESIVYYDLRQFENALEKIVENKEDNFQRPKSLKM